MVTLLAQGRKQRLPKQKAPTRTTIPQVSAHLMRDLDMVVPCVHGLFYILCRFLAAFFVVHFTSITGCSLDIDGREGVWWLHESHKGSQIETETRRGNAHSGLHRAGDGWLDMDSFAERCREVLLEESKTNAWVQTSISGGILSGDRAMSEDGNKPTIIYLPSEIEWYAEDATWTLDIENQKISLSDGGHYTESDLHNAVSHLTIEMLAQLESLAAYVDDLETQLGIDEIEKIHVSGNAFDKDFKSLSETDSSSLPKQGG